MNNQRVKWIDYTKAFACLLVVLGHLLMSLRSIDRYSEFTEFIIWFIYLFHMPLFMCMSGLLYHRRTKIKNFSEYKKFELKKIINLLIPYFTFYCITMLLNIAFSKNVNSPKGLSEWIGIFNNPISPYWFLYALLSLFIIIPIFEKIFSHNKKIVMFIFLILKIISFYWSSKLYFIKSIMGQGIYFYIGAFIKDDDKKNNYIYKSIVVILYIIFALLVYSNIDIFNTKFLKIIIMTFGITGTLIVISLFKNIKNSKFLDSYKNYTFQIFLMHTIFAAGMRILLFKFNITNYFIHIIIGLFASIYIPVFVSIISNKIKFTNFFFYPLKTIEEYRGGKIL